MDSSDDILNRLRDFPSVPEIVDEHSEVEPAEQECDMQSAESLVVDAVAPEPVPVSPLEDAESFSPSGHHAVQEDIEESYGYFLQFFLSRSNSLILSVFHLL